MKNEKMSSQMNVANTVVGRHKFYIVVFGSILPLVCNVYFNFEKLKHGAMCLQTLKLNGELTWETIPPRFN